MALKALEDLLKFGDDKLGVLALPFYKELEDFIVAHAKSEKCNKEFGKGLLFALCGVYANQKIRVRKEAMPLLRKLLSLKISIDVNNLEEGTPFDLSKRRGNWDFYEALNLSQMGESLKGSLAFFSCE